MCWYAALALNDGTPRRLPNLGKLEAVSMFRLQRQYPIICELNVVLPNSQSLGNRHTNANQRHWWDLFGKRQPEGVVERLERNLESWGSRNKGDTSRVLDVVDPCNSTLFDSPHGEGYWLPHPGEAMGNWQV